MACSTMVELIYNVVQQGHGSCPTCRSLRGRGPRTDIEVARREFRNAGAVLKGDFLGVRDPSDCWCMVCKEPITPTLHNIRNGQGACVYCAGKRITPQVAVATMIAAHAEPQTLSVAGEQPWPCLCLRCQRKITPTLESVPDVVAPATSSRR